jgi:hypothetical protein
MRRPEASSVGDELELLHANSPSTDNDGMQTRLNTFRLFIV